MSTAVTGPCWVAILAQMEPTRQTIRRLRGREGASHHGWDERYLQVDIEEEITKAFETAHFPLAEHRQWFVRAARKHGKKTNMETGQWEIKGQKNLKALEGKQVGSCMTRTSKMGRQIIKIVWVVESKMCASFVTFCFREGCKMEDTFDSCQFD